MGARGDGRHRRAWKYRGREARCPAWRCRTRPRPADPGDAERAFACVPACARRAHRHARRRRRQFLDLAAGHVLLARSRRRRCIRSGDSAGVRRDAQGRIHGGRRIPLRSPRSERRSLCRPGRARAPGGRCRERNRHRAHAVAGVLRAFWIRRCRADRGPASLSAYDRRLRAPGRRAAAGCCGDGLRARRRTAQPARGDAGRARRGRCDGGRGLAGSHSCRRAGARGGGQSRLQRCTAGAMAARPCKWSMRAGASCTRRTS